MIAGMVAGLLSGLIGIGGGVVIVPLLYHIFTDLQIPLDVTMPLAIGTSLVSIVFTASMSARSHHKRGNIDWWLLKRWAPFLLLGVVLSTWLARGLDGLLLKQLFGFLLMITALHMIISRFFKLVFAEQLPGITTQGVIATAIGGISSLLGIGGGTLVTPALNVFHYPIHRAVANATVVGVMISLPASISYGWSGWDVAGLPMGSTGYINWLALLAIIPMTLLFAPLGVKLAYRLNVNQLKIVFAIFLCLLGINMALF